jgi:hypothetical protein
VSTGRWYLAALLFAILFWHAYGPGWRMLAALVTLHSDLDPNRDEREEKTVKTNGRV